MKRRGFLGALAALFAAPSVAKLLPPATATSANIIDISALPGTVTVTLPPGIEFREYRYTITAADADAITGYTTHSLGEVIEFDG